MKKMLITIVLVFCGVVLFAQDEKPEKTVMKPALLVIDVQKQFLPMMSKEDQDKALMMMNWSIWVFRQYGLPVIRVYHTSDKWGPKPEDPGFQFADTLKVLDADPKIVKTYGSAFNKTDLDKLLKEKGINTLFMCGLSSVGCVLATYTDAANYDYKAFLVKDALLGPDAAHTDQIETILDAVGLEMIDYMLEIRAE